MTTNINKTETTTETTKLMNGLYASEFDKNWEMAKNYIDAVNQIAQRAENIDADQLYQIFDTKTIPEREEANKKLKTKQNKRQKKKNDKFVVVGLKKPQNVRNVFREQYKKQCAAENKPFDKNEFDTAFKSLSPDAREALNLEVKATKDAFDVEYNQQLARAVAAGDHPEKAPTKFKRAYIIFTEDMRNAIVNTADSRMTKERRDQFVNMSMTEKSKAFGELWKTVSEEEKARYSALEKEAELAYMAEYYDYSVRVLERQIAKAEREGHDAAEYRARLVETQLKPPSVEARTMQPKYYSHAPNVSNTVPVVTYVDGATPVEKPKKAKKVATEVVATSEPATVSAPVVADSSTTSVEKSKKAKKT